MTSPLANWFSTRISAAVEVVADEALGPEADGDADDPDAGHGRRDVEPEAAEDHQPGDDDDEEAEDVAAELVERVHPLLELDRAQFLGRALGRLAVQQRLDDAVDEQAGEAQRDVRDDGDEQASGTRYVLGQTSRIVLQGLVVEVGHGA